MTAWHRPPRPQRRTARRPSRREWIGGRLSPPFSIHDRAEPYRPELAVWIEEPSGIVVGQELLPPEAVEGAVGRTLRTALERPLMGAPRQPDAIRVADAALAAEARAVVGATIPVTVAPTPELDAFLDALVAGVSDAGEEASYLAGGRIAPAAVAELFSAAQLLYHTAPWEVADDGQLLRVDIPALDVSGACLSIIGNLGESLGFLLFPSLGGYDAFVRAAEGEFPQTGPIDLGTDWLALSFTRESDLPEAMRHEVATHGWTVAAGDAYPQVERRARDGSLHPLTDRDLKVAAACAISLSTFFVQHRHRFATEEFVPVSESYSDADDLTVRFTLPYEAFSLFEDGEPLAPAPPLPARAASPKVGRNDPCPCGSGRKYKKCHLRADEEARRAAGEPDPAHDLDEELVYELAAYAAARFGGAWLDHKRPFTDAGAAIQLALPWAVYHYQIEGTTVVDWYLQEHGHRLSRAQRAWLVAQGEAWLSVWEVTAVEPGVGLTLRDLLSGEVRSVHEVSGSQTLVVRDTVLARVVDHDGVSVLCGVHPRPLPPMGAAEVVRRARGRLRRKRQVPVERLRGEGITRYLIRRWEEAVAELDAQSAVPPRLQNTDGDPLLLTTDHFEITPGEADTVAAQLAALEGVERPDPEGDPEAYLFLRPGNRQHRGWENTIVGHARLSDTGLAIDTNSLPRADALRARIESACGDRLRHRSRTHADPRSAMAALPEHTAALPPRPPGAERLELAFKERHYADWLDEPIQALGGETPREAARTPDGRAAVDLLLKEIENQEHRTAGAAAFDFAALREELGLQ
ncbi:MAG: SEC-C metal-binding domain-containing protein [Nitrospirota bacterium]|jgi:hypothetical protein